MRRLDLLGAHLPDRCTTLRRNVPTALVIVMLAGVALPAEAKDDESAAPQPAVALPEATEPQSDAAQTETAPVQQPQTTPPTMRKSVV